MNFAGKACSVALNILHQGFRIAKMLFTYIFSLFHNNLSVSIFQRKNLRDSFPQRGKDYLLQAWGKRLALNPASRLASLPT